MKQDSNVIFISGIDTDAGKSYATGWLAAQLSSQGKSVITMKMVQTGNVGSSEDIEVHRRITGSGKLSEDEQHLTAPQIFSYPASAHLAARLEGKKVDIQAIDKALDMLKTKYDIVLIEGAGGLMVPLAEDYLTIDYVVSRKLPVALVTNGKLGSINHTLLAMEALKIRDIKVEFVLYNKYFDSDKIIADETYDYLSKATAGLFPEAEYLAVPAI